MNKLIEQYKTGIAGFNEEIAVHKNKINLIFYSRSILFIAAIASFFFFVGNHAVIAICIVPITVILFLVMMQLEIKTARKITFLQNRIKVNEVEINLLNNNYENQDEGKEFIDKHHDFTADLDIFGRRSIFQVLNRTSTYTGRIKLAGWLSNPFLDKIKIVRKQDAVKELAGKSEWSQRFAASGYANKEGAADKDIIKEWLFEEADFSALFFKIVSVLLPVFTLLALAMYSFKLTGSGAFIILFLLQLMVTGFNTKKINWAHDKLSRKFDSIEKYLSLISLIETEKFDAAELLSLKADLEGTSESAYQSIRKLKKLVNTLDARLNIAVALVLNGMLLWDINVMHRIETWRGTHKEDFLKWIDSIGEMDALISLGFYSHGNADYTFPEVHTDKFIIDAANTGHPLINADKLVKNNYFMEGVPKVDLLTGANMAGKSTFLRTIGVNLTLAMIGAPVCATKFKFTPLLLFTSLRTNDSLQENESFFYAELKRLQLLIDRLSDENSPQVFFLLDEILKGTNSKDQHTGSEALVKKIIKLKGVGIVATHDVELSKLSITYPDNVRNLCFEITINGDKLDFDYTLKEGVCSTMNATFLMRKMRIIDLPANPLSIEDKSGVRA